MMVKKIVKYGNSQAIVLPREVTEAVGLSVGAFADVSVENGCISIRPVQMIPTLPPADKAWLDEFYRKHEQVFKALAE
ncbi:MAG: hypothetical protein IT449_19030 [Phycisphaerales bacterium]|nr:hypothetical protein [Phycisphaerales bacterium]